MIARALYSLQLRQRLLLVEAAFFAVVLAGVLATTVWYADSLKRRIDRERLNGTVSLAGEVDRLLIDGATSLRLLSEVPTDGSVGTWPGGWMSTMFTAGVLEVDAQGRLLVADPGAGDLRGTDLTTFLANAQRGPAGLRGWAMPRPSASPVMALAVPLAGGGYVVGLIDQEESSLAQALRSAKLIGQTGHADVLDATGVSMVSTEPEHVLHVADHPDFYHNMLSRTEHAPRDLTDKRA